MTRSRLVVVWSSVVVAAGLAAALGALVLDPAREAVGPLPPEGTALLPEARFVMGLDVQRFAASPFYKRYGARGGRPDAFAELQAKTGLDPERDVEHVFVAGGARVGQRAAALVMGRFDRSRIARAIETEKRGVTWKSLHGTNVYLFGESSRSPGALAFLDDSSIVLGAQASVEAAVANHAAGPGPASNGPLVALLRGVRPGSTFWMVGDGSLLANLSTALPAAGGAGGGAALSLPALRSVIVTGDLDPQVSLSVTGDTIDAAAAKNVADTVRGLVGLVSLQASQKPELARLASAVSVTTEASRVHVDARLPYDLLDALSPSPAPALAPAAP
jgi:hypothetical protein